MDLKEKKAYKVFLFPEKLSNFGLMAILLLSIVICLVIISFGFPKKNYTYVPQYEEIIYNDKLDPVIKIYANVIKSEDQISQQHTINIMYKTTDHSLYKAQIKKTSFIGLTKKDNLVYYSPTTEPSGEITSYNKTIRSSITDIGIGGFKKVFCKIEYVLSDYQDSANITRNEKFVQIGENVIELTKEDIKLDNANTFLDYNEIFSEHNVSISTMSSDETRDSIYSKFVLTSKAAEKFHMDYQLFGVDDEGNIYDLVGYYNLSCTNTDVSYSTTVYVSKSVGLKYLIAKGSYIDKDGYKVELFYKQPYNK